MSRSGDRPLTLFELADLLGRCRYVELVLYCEVGRRAAAADIPAVCVFLSGASHSHAYRAGLLEGRLPVSVGLPEMASCTRSPTAEVDALLAEIAAAPESELLGLLAAGWYPAMLSSYQEHSKSVSSPSDAPISRMLERVISDLEHRIDEGTMLAQRLGHSLEGNTLSMALAACRGPFGTLIP